jgi:CubicO group peptidase (beta-lactamase class C family)
MPMSCSRRQILQLGAAAGVASLGLRPRVADATPWRRPGIGSPVGADELQAVLDELVAKHGVPGAVVGLLHGDEVAVAAAGTANLNTGAEMTPDTAFLTGSITKVWTASLLMTFVDEGIVDLDRPVATYLPHFRLADPRAATEITVRQLLNHSSGIDAGDYLLELGEGPAAHRRYVERLATVEQIHAPGAYSSYCNGGFILAGHLAEHLTGRPWDRLLADRLIAPLGLERTVTHTDEAILHSTAVGSVPDTVRKGGHRAAAKFLLPKSAAPAGATLITTVRDNLAFAAMHIGGGQGRTGARVLSDRSARAMATRTIGRPVGSGGFGLGWGVSAAPVSGGGTLSHSGGSNGGIAQLVALPAAGVAYASYANSSIGYGFHGELQRRVLAAALPTRPAPPGEPRSQHDEPTRRHDPALWAGTFRRKSQVTSIRTGDARIWIDVTMVPDEFQGSEAYLEGQQRSFEVVQTGPATLTSVEPVLLGQPATFTFLEPDVTNRFQLVYSAGRLSRRDH